MTQVAAFGPGSLYVTRTDVANSTPINIGYSQEFTLDEAAEVKELFGQNRYPLVTATGTVKLTGKIKAAMISGIAHNSVFYGQTLEGGQIQATLAEAHAIPGTPYQVVVTGSTNWEADLGVVHASDLSPLTKVASSPATGQYSVSAGTYTFAAADTTVNVLISYTQTATGGQKMTVAQQPIGVNPTFQIDYSTSLVVGGTARPVFIRVYNCVSSKLARAFKLTDFMMPEIDFSASQNLAGNLYLVSYPEIS